MTATMQNTQQVSEQTTSNGQCRVGQAHHKAGRSKASRTYHLDMRLDALEGAMEELYGEVYMEANTPHNSLADYTEGLTLTPAGMAALEKGLERIS